MVRKEKQPMTPSELDELLSLNGWTRAGLAGELRMSEAGVNKWYNRGEIPEGPVSILLREWLVRSRQGLPLYTPEPRKLPQEAVSS
jgi:DNA-binding transcriptional regulator YiaG